MEFLKSPLEIFLQGMNSGFCNERLKITQSFNFRNIFVFDLRLDSRGDKEDKSYMKSPAIRVNVRRGSSIMCIMKIFEGNLIETTQKKDLLAGAKFMQENIQSALWVRRGLIKFFDVRVESINEALGYTDKSHSKSKKDTKQRKYHEITFNEVENYISRGFCVDIYQTEKANGENVQVSYIKLLKKWIISSKNCSMIVSDSSEIENYSDDRYKFTKLIASNFLSPINQIVKLDELQEYLSDKTLIGEYIGNPNFKHIVTYQNEEIKFFAIVNNDSPYSCVPVLESFYIFKRFSIPRVKINKIGTFSNKVEMYKRLKLLIKEISNQSLESCGEGSVLYIVANKTEKSEIIEQLEFEVFSESSDLTDLNISLIVSEQITISLAKIKTIEYRIYRKIRETVKLLKNESEICEKRLDEFKNYVKSIMNSEEKDVEFYVNEFFKAAEKVIDLRKLEKINEKNLNESGKLKSSKNSTSELIVFVETLSELDLDFSFVAEKLNLNYNSSKNLLRFKEGCLYHNCLSKGNIPEINKAFYIFINQAMKNIKSDEGRNQKKSSKNQKKNKRNSCEDERRQIYNKIKKNHSNQNTHLIELHPDIDEDIILEKIQKILGSVKSDNKKKYSKTIFFPVILPYFEDSSLFSTLLSILESKQENYIENIKLNRIKSLTPGSIQEENFGLILNRLASDEENKSDQDNRFYFVSHNLMPNEISELLKLLKRNHPTVRLIGIIPATKKYKLTKKENYELSENFLIRCLKNLANENKDIFMENIYLLIRAFKEFNSCFIEEMKTNLACFINISCSDEDFEIDDSISTSLRYLIQDKKIAEPKFEELFEYLQRFEMIEPDYLTNLKESISRYIKN